MRDSFHLLLFHYDPSVKCIWTSGCTPQRFPLKLRCVCSDFDGWRQWTTAQPTKLSLYLNCLFVKLQVICLQFLQRHRVDTFAVRVSGMCQVYLYSQYQMCSWVREVLNWAGVLSEACKGRRACTVSQCRQYPERTVEPQGSVTCCGASKACFLNDMLDWHGACI